MRLKVNENHHDSLKDVPKGLALTGRVSSWLEAPVDKLPVSCTVIKTREELGGLEGILYTLLFASKGLRYAAGVAINLSDIEAVKTRELEPGQITVVLDKTHPDWEAFKEVAKSNTHGVIFKARPSVPPSNIYVVEDSMEGAYGIEESWLELARALEQGYSVTFDLTKLRPAGTDNGKGLTSSGAGSFAKFFPELVHFLEKGDLLSLCRLVSLINQELRRGGAFKNGAITVYTKYDSPSCLDFINMKTSEYPWIKRAVYVDEGLKNHPIKEALAEAVDKGYVWLAKEQYDQHGERLYSNVCLTSDTWVETDHGITQIKDLIHKDFQVPVNGQMYKALSPMVKLDGVPLGRINTNGFFQTGVEPTCYVNTNEGFRFSGTFNHKVLTERGMVEAKDLVVGDKIVINSYEDYTWEGVGNFSQGYVLGSLIGDGAYETAGSTWGVDKSHEVATLIKHLNNLQMEYKKPRERVSSVSTGLATLAVSYVVKGNKTVSETIEKTSMDFYRGFLRGYFDADGTVTLGKKGGVIYLTSINLEGLRRVQRMLLRLGIFSRIHVNKYDNTGDLYHSKPASRLDITGQKNIKRFFDVVGFEFEDNQEALESWVNSSESFYQKEEYATFSGLEFKDFEPVFDCTIDEVHQFPANGILVSNCLEILLRSRGTCLLSHINAGLLKPEELPEAFEKGMEYLCNLHKFTGVDDGGFFYLSPEEDRQVGLGVIGLANHLAIEGVTYEEFVTELEALEKATNGYDDDLFYEICPCAFPEDRAKTIAYYLVMGFKMAEKVAKDNNMDRAFTIAPTATSFTKHEDKEGFSVAPEISPPIALEIERASETFGIVEYEFNPKSETAFDVGWDVQWRLLNAWQRLMDSTGLGHSISSNIWSTCKVDSNWIDTFLDSDIKTTYYRLAINQFSNDKSQILDDETLGKMASAYETTGEKASDYETEEQVAFCSFDDIMAQECKACSGS